MQDISIAARLFMISGKLHGLNQGLTFYDTPSGEKVNSRLLATYLVIATIEYLKNKGALEYRLDDVPAIGGRLPVVVLKRLNTDGVGFEKIILEKLDIEKNLIELVKDIIGARYQMPEYQILWLIRSEFPPAEFMRKEQVKTLFLSRWETRWIPEKVQPAIDSWLGQLAPVWDIILKLPWIQTGVRDCNFAYSGMMAAEKRHD